MKRSEPPRCGPHPLWPGTVGPEPAPPPPAPGSWRRTTSIDAEHVDVATRHLRVRARGHDLRTDRDGRVEVADEAHVRLESTPGGVAVTEIRSADPDLVAPLHLAPAGLRRQVGALAPHLALRAPLLHQILDDLPVLLLVASSSLARTGRIPVSALLPPVPDLCAGWRADGIMVREAGEGRRTLLGQGPVLPAPGPATGPDGPGAVAPLPPGSVRRARRMDATAPDGAGGREITALFRDSFFEEDGAESVIHEYGVQLSVDADLVVRSATAVPRVLPGPDCPAAAASAGQLVGHSLADLAGHVRRQMRGPATCTHLNDTFVALGGLDLRPPT